MTAAAVLGCLIGLGLAPFVTVSSAPRRTAASPPPGWSLVTLPWCRVAPCAIYGGTEIKILDVNVDLARMTGLSHLTYMRVEYFDLSEPQVLYPGSDLYILDAAGSWHSVLATFGGHLARTCQDPTQEAFTLQPGMHAGPFGLCFQAGGPVAGRMLLMYAPHTTNDVCRPIGGPFALGPLYDVNPSRTGSLLEDHIDKCDAALISLSSSSVSLVDDFSAQ